jgi:glc operon protein GlcG
MLPYRALMALTVGASFWLAAPAMAQQPAQTAPAATPSPEYGLPLNNAQAREIAAAALLEAKNNNWRMAIAIVGPDGELLYFEKMDGTQSASAALAVRKARTSAMFRRPSKAFADQFAAGNIGFMTFPDEARPIASEGGLPILIDGKIVGAIGASGGTGPQDGQAAAAGVGAVKGTAAP